MTYLVAYLVDALRPVRPPKGPAVPDATDPQTPDPVTPTLHNVLYGALSASLLDHGVRLEAYVRGGIRDDIERAITEFNAEEQP